MPENPITIQFTYSADDYVEGSRAAALYFTPAKRRVSWIAIYLLTAVGIIGGPWIFLSNPSDHSAWLIASAVFGSGLWYLYALAVHFWRDRFGRRREFPRIEILQGLRQMQFGETSHQTKAPQFAYDAAWDCYKAYVETAKLFVLSQPPGYAIIPKRAFSTDQLAAFQQMLSTRVPTAQPRSRGRGFLIALGVGIAILLALYAALLIFAPKP
jgi:YcxB-like protein